MCNFFRLFQRNNFFVIIILSFNQFNWYKTCLFANSRASALNLRSAWIKWGRIEISQLFAVIIWWQFATFAAGPITYTTSYQIWKLICEFKLTYFLIIVTTTAFSMQMHAVYYWVSAPPNKCCKRLISAKKINCIVRMWMTNHRGVLCSCREVKLTQCLMVELDQIVCSEWRPLWSHIALKGINSDLIVHQQMQEVVLGLVWNFWTIWLWVVILSRYTLLNNNTVTVQKTTTKQ